ncbi:hypothetical protein [uncultured Prevotella sp.]|uniref:hypothetical protein n=1 Tax=uncultured Prevotella sp. TaxID=159272 RepID=UPI0025960070|nr:hypothetical protein [uncultured Prevotella sp.]
MKRTRFSLLIALIAMSLSATAQTASQVLRSLTFDAPKALYHPKGNSANMRQTPSTKARKVAVYKSYDQGWWLPTAQLVADEGDNPDWVKANVEGKTVYMSKSVMAKVEPEPFMVNKCQNLPYLWETIDNDETAGWEGQAMSWRIGKVKGQSGLYVAEVIDYDGATSLRLGKMVNNVLVFKYKVFFAGGSGYERLEGVGKWVAEKEACQDYPYNGAKVCYFRWSNDMLYKADIDFKDGDGGMIYENLDLTKLTEPMVYTIFKDEIDSGRINYFYLTSFNFTSKWER